MPQLKALSHCLKGNILHPQWLSDRFHIISSRLLHDIHDSVVIDIGSGSNTRENVLGKNNTYCCLDYPTTNQNYQLRPHVFGDACGLPFKSTSADAVLLLEVLEHVPSPDKALSEIHRVLKPGGRLYISVPFIYPIHDEPYDYRRFTVHGIKQLLIDQQLNPVYESQHGNSFVTALQMINLSILESIYGIARKNRMLALALIPLGWPICFLINLIAAPFLLLPWKSRSCFGYFIIAHRL